MSDKVKKLMQSAYYKFQHDWCVDKPTTYCQRTDCSACELRLEAGWIGGMKQVQKWINQLNDLAVHELINCCCTGETINISEEIREELKLLGEQSNEV